MHVLPLRRSVINWKIDFSICVHFHFLFGLELILIPAQKGNEALKCTQIGLELKFIPAKTGNGIEINSNPNWNIIEFFISAQTGYWTMKMYTKYNIDFSVDCWTPKRQDMQLCPFSLEVRYQYIHIHFHSSISCLGWNKKFYNMLYL